MFSKKKFIALSSDKFLYLTILPTEKCNFRCVYCYETFELGNMSEKTVKGIKNLLSESVKTIKHLKISWFGGEPTLNMNAIVEISSHIIELQKQYKFKYESIMTTNAYLIDSEVMSNLCNLGINNFQITLDGEKRSK